MTDNNSFIDILVKLWPIFTAIIGAIGWIIYQLNMKVSRKECHQQRCDCSRLQTAADVRIERDIKEMRVEFRNGLDKLTELIVAQASRKGDK